MTGSLVVNEIYLSLQGESTFAGLPCVFIRLTGCPLRCSYCDTVYAFTQGSRMATPAILAEVGRLAAPYHTAAGAGRMPLVELTGGEPLAQRGAAGLMEALCNDGFTVLVETGGSLDISQLDPRVRRIMDLKCPSSGEVGRNRWANLPHLRPTDEIKFVIGTREDYDWAVARIAEHRLAQVCPLLFSWVHPPVSGTADPVLKPVPAGQTPITRRELAELVIADALPVRFQAQLHKVIWPPAQRGV